MPAQGFDRYSAVGCESWLIGQRAGCHAARTRIATINLRGARRHLADSIVLPFHPSTPKADVMPNRGQA